MYDSRHDTLRVLVCHIIPLHCVRFSRTRLSVCHYSTVESVQDILQYWQSHLLEHVLLRWVSVKRKVKHKWHLILFLCLWVLYYELRLVRYSVQFLGKVFELFFIKRTEAAVDFDIALFFLHLYLIVWKIIWIRELIDSYWWIASD